MTADQNQKITFTCNICGTLNTVELSKLSREVPSCDSCGSTVRMRSIIHVLTSEIFGRSTAIPDIDPPHPLIVGIGMSCWYKYAHPLAHKVTYTNTFYHEEPRLDITDIPDSMVGKLDFIISSDVFEHVKPPVNRAFQNARRLLKPDGVLIFTVPYFHPGEEKVVTTENFPGLHEFTIVQNADTGPMLRNQRTTGEIEYFYNLNFHGGDGQTLEMRRFSEWSLFQELKDAGFNDISVYRGDYLKYGIRWPLHSAPMAARVVPREPHQEAVQIRVR